MNRPSSGPAISVCIPVRNGGAHLRHTLVNLLVHSTYPPDRWEVVIGDHDSSDGTASIIADFQERFSSLRSIRVPFRGPNRAFVRNRMIAESRGELLVFIDHDVLVSDDFLWNHVEAHSQFPASIVAGTIFGTALDQQLGRFDGQLELDHISSSHRIVMSNQELFDPRIPPFPLPEGIAAVDVLQVPAPFRLFWGGNLSAYRTDINACGRFDEAYNGWGLEDDDFAQQFRAHGRRLIFSPAAWGFHLPGRPQGWNHVAEWRRNFETFFRKFPTREIEAYSLYGSALLPVGIAKLDAITRQLKGIDTRGTIQRVCARLGPPRGRRACHFVAPPEAAESLGLTDALSPFGSWTDGHRANGRTHWWPLFGFKTPFANAEIDEFVVLVNVLMWLDRYLLTLVLSETARTAKRVVLCDDAEATSCVDGFPLTVLHEVLRTLRFADYSWITV